LRRRHFILLIIALLILFGCAQQGGTLPPAGENEVIYQSQRFWTEEQFSAISDTDLMELFQKKYDVDARDFNFTFNGTSHSTITQCHVYGEVSKSGDEYVADFSWFLDSLTLDFINDNFEESETGLSWEGNINGVPTSIRIACPKQDSVYEAWQHPVGHCHAHIWWPASSGNMVKCVEMRGKNDNYQ